MTVNVAVLGSGQGSYLIPLIAALKAIPVNVALAISNVKNSGFLAKSSKASIPSVCIEHKGLTRESFDIKLDEALKAHDVELVILVGFMRILGRDVCEKWPQKIINIHPSLLPKHQGLMDLAVHQAVIDGGDKETGCSVHFVTADVDAGPVVCQLHCDVLDSDDRFSLKKKVQALEITALVNAVKKIVGKNP